MIESTSSFVTGAVSRAYKTSQALPATAPAQSENSSRPSFGEVMERTAMQTLETVRQGDQAAVAGLAGALPMQQVVEATMAMESAVKVTVAVRDRMVEAYQEILRMAV